MKIVKYENRMNNMALRNFNSSELDLLMSICSKMLNQQTNNIIFSFSELKKIMNLQRNITNKDFFKLSKKTYTKLLNCVYEYTPDDDTYIMFTLFTKFEIKMSTKTISVIVNPEFSWILNELTSNFTKFELDEFTSLKSSYSKEIYRRLKQFKKTGVWRVKIEKFGELLSIPTWYRMSEIDKKVLAISKRELSEIFKNLEVIKIKSGRRVEMLEFRFLKEKNVINEETEIIKKNDNKDILDEQKMFGNEISNDSENYFIFEDDVKKYIRKDKFLEYCIQELENKFIFLKEVKEKFVINELEKNKVIKEKEEIILEIEKLKKEENFYDYIEKYAKGYIESVLSLQESDIG